MGQTLNIQTVLNQVFGVSFPSFSGKPNNPNYNYKGLNIVENDIEADRISYLGTPIIHTITLKGKTYKVFDDSGLLVDKKLEDFEMPVVTFSTFRRASVIARTRRPGGQGTVKELYGKDDWSIDIRGLCLRDPAHKTATSASEQERRLLEFEKVAGSIEVVSDLYNNKGVYNIVILDISIGQLPGKPGTIPFTIRTLSDEPTELIL